MVYVSQKTKKKMPPFLLYWHHSKRSHAQWPDWAQTTEKHSWGGFSLTRLTTSNKNALIMPGPFTWLTPNVCHLGCCPSWEIPRFMFTGDFYELQVALGGSKGSQRETTEKRLKEVTSPNPLVSMAHSPQSGDCWNGWVGGDSDVIVCLCCYLWVQFSHLNRWQTYFKLFLSTHMLLPLSTEQTLVWEILRWRLLMSRILNFPV